MLLHFTPFGRGVYEIGLNAETAHFSGVDVRRSKLLLYVLSGVVSAFAGVFYLLRFDSANTDTGTGLELQVIAAVLLGGVSIFGGRGDLLGVLAGVLLIGVLSSALRLQQTGSDVIEIVIGVPARPLGDLDPAAGPAPRSAGPNQKDRAVRLGAGSRRRVTKGEVMKWKSKRFAATAALALTASLALAGCGSGSSSSPSAGGSSGGGGGDLTVTLIPKNLGNPYFDTSEAGVKKAMSAIGGSYTQVGPQEATPDGQVPFINTATQQGTKAIVISSDDPSAPCDALKQAMSAGIKVVTFDSDTNPDCRDVFVNQATAEGIAKVQVDMIAKDDRRLR